MEREGDSVVPLAHGCTPQAMPCRHSPCPKPWPMHPALLSSSGESLPYDIFPGVSPRRCQLQTSACSFALLVDESSSPRWLKHTAPGQRQSLRRLLVFRICLAQLWSSAAALQIQSELAGNLIPPHCVQSARYLPIFHGSGFLFLNAVNKPNKAGSLALFIFIAI